MSQIDEVVCVNKEALKAIVLKRAHFTVLQGDWTMRKHESGIGFEERELMRLEQAVEDAKNALYYKLLELETAKHYICQATTRLPRGRKVLRERPDGGASRAPRSKTVETDHRRRGRVIVVRA